MNSQLGNDPDMCEKLIPKYELGCKRILFSLMEFLPLFVDRRRKMRPTLVTDEVAEVTEADLDDVVFTDRLLRLELKM